MYPRVAMVSTFPPTQCGIATFAEALARELSRAGLPVGIVDLPSGPGATAQEPIVHRHRGSRDLPVTSPFLNSFDVVILQHEFGIWDGPDGAGILDLIASLSAPVITILHTVPATPRGRQRAVLQQLLDLSDAVVVLSHSARRRLLGDYAPRTETLWTIPHGAESRWSQRTTPPTALPPRILTWGLLGPGKGVEWGIAAMALLRRRRCPCEYVIAGATHPNVLRTDGDSYRQSLLDLTYNLGVTDRVSFVPDYLDDRGLADLIATSAAFLLPYDSREQITSGVLVEAIAAGGPVVATRFPHAVELLGDGTGALVDHGDPVSIADALERIFADDGVDARMRERSSRLAESLAWESVGAQYAQLAQQLWRGRRASRRPTLSETGARR